MPPPTHHRQFNPAATEAWFVGSAGQALLTSEVDCVRLAGLQWPGHACLWLGPASGLPASDRTGGLRLRLHRAEGELFAGDVRCQLPLPIASESCACVILQHVLDMGGDPAVTLQECARILLPGGQLWLLALNPISPYRLRWQGQGLQASEPIRWRRRLRAAGLSPEPVSQGLGPSWSREAVGDVQDGAGLRAAFLLRAHKRRQPLTPMRKPRLAVWQPGATA